MSDIGVIVTGVVVGSASGIGGAILGAWMNGRQQMAALRLQLSAADMSERRADKRQIYGRVLADTADYVRVRYFDEGKKQEAVSRLASSLSEMLIVAPPELAKLGQQYAIALERATKGSDTTEQFRLRDQLVREMTADLGYEMPHRAKNDGPS